MPDVTQLLNEDHRKVEQLFERYRRGERSVVADVRRELELHTLLEESIVYPAPARARRRRLGDAVGRAKG